MHDKVLGEVSPQIILLLGPNEMKEKYIEWCEAVYSVNFKVLKKDVLLTGNSDLSETNPA